MREKQELLKREGERERDPSSLSMYARWGSVIRDDGNIKSGEHRSHFSNYSCSFHLGLYTIDMTVKEFD